MQALCKIEFIMSKGLLDKYDFLFQVASEKATSSGDSVDVNASPVVLPVEVRMIIFYNHCYNSRIKHAII